MKNKTNKATKARSRQQTQSLIAAVLHVSESEVALAYPDYNASWETDTPSIFKQILWNFGLNVEQAYVLQPVKQHRNRLNQIVTCCRWYGSERNDKEWLTSGYASQAAIDRAKNCLLLDDLYRSKHLTLDAQYALEQRDRNDVIEE